MTEDRNSLTLFSETELNSLDSNDTVLTVDHSSAMESAVPLVGPNPARVGQDQQVEDQEGMLLSRAEQEGVGDGASMQVAWEGRVDRRKTNRFR